MAAISMKALLESGVHFGHRTNKWDPRMKPYIFTERNGIHIIDLQQTVKLLNNALAIVRDAVAAGGTVLFVGTKRQAQETIRDEATRAGMPYVTERWLGGMLTNWSTMYARIQELDRLEGLRDTGEISRLTKKEGLLIQREIDRLLIRLSGVRKMRRLPELLFVVDVSREEAAVHEANLLGVPVVALVDTNCNPQGIDYVIPSNDDAIRAIKLLVAKVADAALEGKAMRKEQEPEEVLETAHEGASAMSHLRNTERVVESDEEVEEGALLGESTLAKLSATRKPEEVAPIGSTETESIEGPKTDVVELDQAAATAAEVATPKPEAGPEGA
ncbi:MAG TPA: 30S ribosomal protein S2 [Anaerolineales bacterium]